MNTYRKLLVLFLCLFSFLFTEGALAVSCSCTGSVAGHVNDCVTNAPIANAKIELRRCNHVIATTFSAADGSFTFLNVKGGEYNLHASAAGYENKFTGCRVRSGYVTRVRICLKPNGGTIAGQVTNTTYPGPGINGATVSIIRGALIVAQVTTSGGGFYTVPNLAPGCYKVVASAAGFQSNIKGAKVSKGHTTTVNLPLQPTGGTISGTVKNTASAPIADADISLYDGPHLIAATTTDSVGFYTFPNLAAGNYTVEATAEGYQTQVVGATVISGNTTTVDFVLQANPGKIAGTVRDSQTTLAINGALVSVFKGPDLVGFAITDSFGYYEIPGLAPDHYEVFASADLYATSSVGATVQSDQTTVVNFFLVPISGSIAGTVTDHSTHLAIVGATVQIYDGPDLIASALTDDSGNYLVPGLAPGNYTVVISAATYQTFFAGATVTSQNTTTVNAALVLLPGFIAGTVKNASTNPIPGALIEVYDGMTVIGKGTTDANGKYNISGIPPGTYTVVASAYTYRSQSVGATVTAGMTTTVNFTLQSDPGTIAGTVTDATTGSPIKSASIRIFQGTTLISSALTDSSGFYQATGIFPGQYDVVAEATGYQTKTSGVTIIDDSTVIVDFELLSNPGTLEGTITDATTTNPIEGASVDVYLGTIFIASALSDAQGNYSIPNLAPETYQCIFSAPGYQDALSSTTIQSNNTTTLDIALKPFPGSVTGHVQENPSTPIPNATITIYMNNVPVGSTLTDSLGNYTLSGLAPGDYIIVAEADSYQTASQPVQIIMNMTQTVNFTLLPNPGTISGTVTDADTSKPIDGASVALYRGSILIAFAQTDADGFYTLPNLAPGSYTLVADAFPYQAASVGVSVQANATTTVNFALLPDPGALTGTVTSITTSDPIPGVFIEAYLGQVLLGTAVTDGAGQYTIPNLPPGDYTVVAQPPIGSHLSADTEAASIVAEQTTTLDFALGSNAGTFAGMVTNTTPSAIANALISVYSGEILFNSTFTNSSGNYTIGGLPPGQYTVTADATGYQLGFQTGTITAGNTTIINFTLQSNPHAISGTVTDAVTGKPIPGATVSIFSGSTFITYAVTDSLGEYVVNGLANGTYTAEASAVNYNTVDASVTISGSDVVQNFALRPIPLNPTNLTGTSIKNKFLTQTNRMNQITWSPSVSPDVVGYRVYRNGQLVATIPAGGPYVYNDQNQSKGVAVTYTVVTVNAAGETSSGASITVQ